MLKFLRGNEKLSIFLSGFKCCLSFCVQRLGSEVESFVYSESRQCIFAYAFPGKYWSQSPFKNNLYYIHLDTIIILPTKTSFVFLTFLPASSELRHCHHCWFQHHNPRAAEPIKERGPEQVNRHGWKVCKQCHAPSLSNSLFICTSISIFTTWQKYPEALVGGIFNLWFV